MAQKKPYKTEKRTHGTVFSSEVAPTEIEVTCFNCKSPFKKTFDLTPSNSSVQVAYCPNCNQTNKVDLPSADDFYNQKNN